MVPHVCLFVRGVGGDLFPNTRTEAFATAFNTLSLNQIVVYDHEYALLVPVSTDIRMDFIATTAAIKSTCKLKKKECNLNNASSAVTSFNYSVNSTFPDFARDIQNATYGRYSINYDDCNIPLNSCRSAAGIHKTSVSSELAKDPEILTTMLRAYVAIVMGEMLVYDAIYAQIRAGQRYNHKADFSLTNSTLGKTSLKCFGGETKTILA